MKLCSLKQYKCCYKILMSLCDPNKSSISTFGRIYILNLIDNKCGGVRVLSKHHQQNSQNCTHKIEVTQKILR